MRFSIPLRRFMLLPLAAAGAMASAQGPMWQSAPVPLGVAIDIPIDQVRSFAAFQADAPALRAALLRAPLEGQGAPGETILMPYPDGGVRRFRVLESPIQSPAVARQTGVRTFAAQGVDDPWATARFDIGRNGFHGLVFSPSGDYYIEPLSRGNFVDHVVYFKRSTMRTHCFKCWTVSAEPKGGLLRFLSGDPGRPGPNRKEYRLALKGTGEYTAFYGGQPNADAGSVTVMNRVNGVYEKDFAIRMNIVNLVNYTNSATDPYSNGSGSTMLGQNQTTCDLDPGDANYDIGHVFSTGGGGVAGLRVVGRTGLKARGVTGLPQPVGDPFAIDYVAHEMGHQYGGNHSFNGTTSSCGSGRSAAHAYEPGSGTTIMAYAGICGAENIQNFSDDYFHTESQSEIESWRNNAGSGGTEVFTGNNSPTVNAGADFTIPRDTPFRLTATASDADGDSLTYCWEQFNLGTATPSTNESTRPLFRSLPPSTSGTRWLPKQATVLANVFDQWENLPSVDRSMTFRCTVRDNRAGGGNFEWDAAVLTVSGAPFEVTSPNTAVNWAGASIQTVTWNVGGGSVASNVRILLSTDGGASFFNGSATVLIASTPNDGSEPIVLPNINATQARIIVEPIGNIFYDISNVNFTLTASQTQIVNPDAYTVLVGSESVHNLAALLLSDDIRHTIAADSVFNSLTELSGTCPTASVARLSFILESHTNFNGRRRKVQFFNFQTSLWEELSVTPIPLTDGTVQVDVTTNPNRFIEAGTRRILARIACDFPTAARTLARSVEVIDRAVWEVRF